MQAAELQARQAPIKDHYAADPSAALITLRATGELGTQSASCSVDVGRRLVEPDSTRQPAATAPWPARVTCSCRHSWRALGSPSARSRSTADWTSAERSRPTAFLTSVGPLGVDREASVDFISIGLAFDLQTDASEEDVVALIRTTERYCVVYQTLKAGTPVSVTTTMGGPAQAER